MKRHHQKDVKKKNKALENEQIRRMRSHMKEKKSALEKMKPVTENVWAERRESYSLPRVATCPTASNTSDNMFCC